MFILYIILKQSMWIQMVDLTFNGYSVKSSFIRRYLRKDSKCRWREITICCREEQLWVPGIWKIFGSFEEWQKKKNKNKKQKTKNLYGYRGDKNICHPGMRSVSIPWDYWGILPFSNWDVKLLEDLKPRLDPTVMTRDQGHSLHMPYDAQMKGVIWGDEHSLSGYEREGEFIDTEKWVDRINEITWKCSPEFFPFLSKIENSITTISSFNWEGQMSTWIRSMQSTWETQRRVWHLKSRMSNGTR